MGRGFTSEITRWIPVLGPISASPVAWMARSVYYQWTGNPIFFSLKEKKNSWTVAKYKGRVKRKLLFIIYPRSTTVLHQSGGRLAANKTESWPTSAKGTPEKITPGGQDKPDYYWPTVLRRNGEGETAWENASYQRVYILRIPTILFLSENFTMKKVCCWKTLTGAAKDTGIHHPIGFFCI